MPGIAERLKHRARLYQAIRDFFQQKNILEVETPIFSPFANTDPYIQSIHTTISGKTYYAHTSPEFAMKRLLCEGSGDIFQICKVFRDEEHGRIHRPEFTMLEWYCLKLDYKQLALEVVSLLKSVGIEGEIKAFTYRQLFQHFLNVDIFNESVTNLRALALRYGLNDCGLGDDLDGWRNYLLTHLIEPQLTEHAIVILSDFPASQAALAKLSSEDDRIAQRFEVYVRGMELANGYQELTSPVIYQQRFERENQIRLQRGAPVMPIDKSLLSALNCGFPECAGVALGVDRLLMMINQKNQISDVETLPT